MNKLVVALLAAVGLAQGIGTGSARAEEPLFAEIVVAVAVSDATAPPPAAAPFTPVDPCHGGAVAEDATSGPIDG